MKVLSPIFLFKGILPSSQNNNSTSSPNSNAAPPSLSNYNQMLYLAQQNYDFGKHQQAMVNIAQKTPPQILSSPKSLSSSSSFLSSASSSCSSSTSSIKSQPLLSSIKKNANPFSIENLIQPSGEKLTPHKLDPKSVSIKKNKKNTTKSKALNYTKAELLASQTVQLVPLFLMQSQTVW